MLLWRHVYCWTQYRIFENGANTTLFIFFYALRSTGGKLCNNSDPQPRTNQIELRSVETNRCYLNWNIQSFNIWFGDELFCNYTFTAARLDIMLWIWPLIHSDRQCIFKCIRGKCGMMLSEVVLLQGHKGFFVELFVELFDWLSLIWVESHSNPVRYNSGKLRPSKEERFLYSFSNCGTKKKKRKIHCTLSTVHG